MTRCCISGELIEVGTDEHVIPQWIIRQSGGARLSRGSGIDPSQKKSNKDTRTHKSANLFSTTLPASAQSNEAYNRILEQPVQLLWNKLGSNIEFEVEEFYAFSQWALFLIIKQMAHNLSSEFNVTMPANWLFIPEQILGCYDTVLTIWRCPSAPDGIATHRHDFIHTLGCPLWGIIWINKFVISVFSGPALYSVFKQNISGSTWGRGSIIYAFETGNKVLEPGTSYAEKMERGSIVLRDQTLLVASDISITRKMDVYKSGVVKPFANVYQTGNFAYIDSFRDMASMFGWLTKNVYFCSLLDKVNGQRARSRKSLLSLAAEYRSEANKIESSESYWKQQHAWATLGIKPDGNRHFK